MITAQEAYNRVQHSLNFDTGKVEQMFDLIETEIENSINRKVYYTVLISTTSRTDDSNLDHVLHWLETNGYKVLSFTWQDGYRFRISWEK